MDNRSNAWRRKGSVDRRVPRCFHRAESLPHRRDRRDTLPTRRAGPHCRHDLVDIFAVQDEIMEAVTIAVAPAIDDAEPRRAMRKPPESPPAESPPTISSAGDFAGSMSRHPDSARRFCGLVRIRKLTQAKPDHLNHSLGSRAASRLCDPLLGNRKNVVNIILSDRAAPPQ